MSASVKLAGVIGWPVSQSLSPVLHGHWLKVHGITGAYVPLAIRPEDFGRCVAALPLMGFAGASVTVPHKQSAYALCADIDEDARATAAVNTLIFGGGAVKGMNTDVRGFAASVTEAFGADAVKGKHVAVLGAGGAARAVILALARLGASEIRIVNRTHSRAEALGAAIAVASRLRVEAWGAWPSAFKSADLIVNTTSLGMVGKDRLDLSPDALPAGAAVADIVYNPLETELLKNARARGLKTMDGLGMLMHQAAPAFAALFGVTPTVTPELRAELVAALPKPHA